MNARMFNFKDGNSTLGQEELKSEYLRSFLLTCFFAAIALVATLNYIFVERSLAEYYGGFVTFSKIVGSINKSLFAEEANESRSYKYV